MSNFMSIFNRLMISRLNICKWPYKKVRFPLFSPYYLARCDDVLVPHRIHVFDMFALVLTLTALSAVWTRELSEVGRYLKVEVFVLKNCKNEYEY